MTEKQMKVVIVGYGNGKLESKIIDTLNESGIDVEIAEELPENKKIALVGGPALLNKSVNELFVENVIQNHKKEIRIDNQSYYNNTKNENKKNMHKIKRMKFGR